MKYDIHRGFIVKPIRLHGIPRKPRVGEGGERGEISRNSAEI